jgi:hypothetical protein
LIWSTVLGQDKQAIRTPLPGAIHLIALGNCPQTRGAKAMDILQWNAYTEGYRNFYQGSPAGLPSSHSTIHTQEENMARHKKIERKKELDRRRQRREKRIKQRIREAKSAA